MTASFHVLEGIDGSGKTTLANAMRDYLTEKNVPFEIVSSYPKDEEGMRMREIWINRQVPPEALVAIVLYLRRRVLLEQIVPALNAGKIVISDRWHGTTWAYNKHADKLPIGLYNALQLQYDPDAKITRSMRYMLSNFNMVYLDLPVADSRKRVGSRGVTKDAFENASDQYFHDVRSGYEAFIHQHQVHTYGYLERIDATQPLEDVIKAAVEYISIFVK